MLVIKNGRVHTGHGEVLHTDLGIENGVFNKVGALSVDASDTVIDASGCDVFPGFINALSYWGIFGPGWTGHDHSELSNPVTPALDVTYAFDHDGMNFQHVTSYGVTAAGVAPLPRNVLAGQAAVYKTYGRSPHRMLIKQGTAMIASISRGVKEAYEGRQVMPMTKMGAFSLLLNALEKTHRLDPEKLAEDRESSALKPVLDGALPLFVNCAGRAEIEAVLHALEPYPNIKLVLTGAYGVDAASLEKAGRHVQIILGDQTEGMNPSSHITDPSAIDALWDQGVTMAIGCCGDDYVAGKESLLWNAIYWHRHGLDPERCLAGITSQAAAVLGVSDRIGAIAPGLDADFSIWSGNPITRYDAVLKHVYIDGEAVGEKEAFASCW